MRHIEILSSAFSNRDSFSIPGLGTFKKVRTSARFENGYWLPPSSQFLFDPLVESKEGLDEFISTQWSISLEEARSQLAKISSWIRVTLKSKGNFLFPGFGELIQKNNTLEFKADRGSQFGLQKIVPILSGLKAPQSPVAPEKKQVQIPPTPPVLEKKKIESVSPKIKEEKTVHKVIIVAKAKPKRRTFSLILLIILAGGITAGIVFREEVKEKLVAWGLIGNKVNGDSLLADSNNASEKIDSQIVNVPIKEIESDIDKTEKSGVSNPPTVTVDGNSDFEDVAEPWVRGNFYLVCGSFLSLETAKASVQHYSSFKDMDVKILSPESGNGLFKVVVFNSPNKKSVISKMVEWKSRFKNNSWIYPPSN